VSNREDVGRESQLLEHNGQPIILASCARGHNSQGVPAFIGYDLYVPRN
jgi:hypothetical protein